MNMQIERRIKRGMAWKKYLNLYQGLLGFDLNEDFPYKELADHFGLDVVVIRHMVNWLQTKPEVVAWVRVKYREEYIPDWVGRIKGNPSDEELVAWLQTKGVKVTTE